MTKTILNHTSVKLFFVIALATGLVLGAVLALTQVVQAAVPPGDSEVTVRTNGIDDDFNSMSLIGALSVITVSTTDDELNSDGDCSLREAIQSANTDTAVDNCTQGNGADTIALIAGTYTLTGTAGEDSNAGGDLDITGDLTINGATNGSSIIDGNQIDRVLEVRNTATVQINNVTITNGQTPDGTGLGAPGGFGGGILNSSGVLTITNSTIFSNTTGTGGTAGAGGSGGGIANLDTLAIINSTISSNTTGMGNGSSGGNGGGISFNVGTVTISSTTIVNNATGGTGGDGGGIYISNLSSVAVKNTILANNTAGTANPDCSDPSSNLTSQGYNLVLVPGNCTTVGTDTTGQDPKLAPLADNGGETRTHALQDGSPALDGGSCSGLTTDQRGRPRPVDLPGIANTDDGCDIGAFEAQGVNLSLTKAANTTTPILGDRITYTITISNAGDLNATNALISDTLPLSFTLAGSITLVPTQATAIVASSALSLPTVASNVTITKSNSERITITIPVTVSSNLTEGLRITNTVELSAAEISAWLSDTVIITTTTASQNTYLPIIIKNS